MWKRKPIDVTLEYRWRYEDPRLQLHHQSEYMANPDNEYHYRYLRIVDRVTLTVIAIMVMIASTVEYGWRSVPVGIGAIVVGLIAAGLLFWILEILLHIFAGIVSSFIDWITGD
ncbi:MAG: hypothetical protein PHN51_11710 [Candidatus Nanopelagicales bacterium]|nr:hypothetical protein [Candidatus Nanopelagicales bacterium]